MSLSVNISNFKEVMSKLITGVTVITTSDAKGQNYGFTANSFTSLSLEPTLILFCISKNSISNQNIRAIKKFAINILTHNQQDLALKFASKNSNKFQDTSFHLSPNNQCPILENIAAYLECNLGNIYDGGDHDIIIGEVIGFNYYNNPKPLIYYNHKFGLQND